MLALCQILFCPFYALTSADAGVGKGPIAHGVTEGRSQ